ncbi:MAG: hypothetical protein KGL39_16685 [Patescibacteria group bacterium]|nr:hypothetical protein [Patescibacteria group bacterium]
MMASLAELEDALVNADKAGDSAAASQLANSIYEAKRVQSAKPTTVQVGGMLNDVGRQVGLTARHGMEGLADTANFFTEPFRIGFEKVTGMPTAPLGAIASRAADFIGLPKPQNSTERVVGEAAKLMAGTGGLAKAAPMIGNALAQGPIGTTASRIWSSLGENIPQQLAAATGAGLAGGASKEAGGNWTQQLAASTLGGLGGAGALALGQAGVNTAKSIGQALSREVGGGMSPVQMDVQISNILGKSGVDYSKVPERLRQGLRSELQSALETGKELSPESVARLLDYKAIGATPTRGTVSLDPIQLTKEKNLASIAANMNNSELHGLPRIQNENNATLIRNLNDLGANRGDLMRAGEAAAGTISAVDRGAQEKVSALYRAARDMPGGTTQLERTPFVNAIYDKLAKENKLVFLPDEIGNMLNTISQGQITRNGQTFAVPFNANALDNLLTTISTAQRSTKDGNVKAALKIAREAIDSVPLTPIKETVGGNTLTTQAQAAALRAADAQAQNFMDALNTARSAAKSRFGWQESARPIENVLSGEAPDIFVKKYVIGGTLDDAKAAARYGGGEMKDAILKYLKGKAINEASDELGKFSQSAYNKALTGLGDRKLALFFSPEEIDKLKAVGRVAGYEQFQPAGSAVNNSKSGALLLGRGLDMLSSLSSKIPFGKAAVVEPMQNIGITIRQNQAQNVGKGLLVPQAKQPILPEQLIVPGIAMGGLLSQ